MADISEDGMIQPHYRPGDLGTVDVDAVADRPAAGAPTTEPTHIRSMHWAAYRSGQWAEILTVAHADGSRSCYVVRFPDGATDFWVVDDPDAQYEFAAAGVST